MLKGKLGWKGERGYSAYEIAVQNGFVGTEQDWLAQLGTSIAIHQYYETHETTEADEDTFDLPEEYTSNSYVEVYVNGKRLLQEEFTLDTTDRQIVLTTPIADVGTNVEVIATVMTTNSLPIVDTITSESTNDTTPGSKVVYDELATKYDKSEVDELLSSKANISSVYTKTESDNKYQVKILSGTTEPSPSLGEDGDIYLKYSN